MSDLGQIYVPEDISVYSLCKSLAKSILEGCETDSELMSYIQRAAVSLLRGEKEPGHFGVTVSLKFVSGRCPDFLATIDRTEFEVKLDRVLEGYLVTKQLVFKLPTFVLGRFAEREYKVLRLKVGRVFPGFTEDLTSANLTIWLECCAVVSCLEKKELDEILDDFERNFNVKA